MKRPNEERPTLRKPPTSPMTVPIRREAAASSRPSTKPHSSCGRFAQTTAKLSVYPMATAPLVVQTSAREADRGDRRSDAEPSLERLLVVLVVDARHRLLKGGVDVLQPIGVALLDRAGVVLRVPAVA